MKKKKVLNSEVHINMYENNQNSQLLCLDKKKEVHNVNLHKTISCEM